MPRPPDDDAISDADLLFRDPAPRREAAPEPAPSDAGEIGGYELAGEDPEEVEAAPPIPIPIPPTPTARKAPSPEPRPGPGPEPRPGAEPRKKAERPVAAEEAPAPEEPAGPPPRVERVWSRWGEWGSTVLTLVLFASFWVASLYLAIRYEWGVDAIFAILVVGGLILIVLSYPIIITLERPLRMTPEQAVRDYFNALSHVRPHYRRMWLLLNSAGHRCKEFDSFAGFQDYWKRKLGEFRARRKIGALTPIAFKVQEFRSEKSAGKSALVGKFTVRVFAERRAGGGAAGEASVLTTKDQLAIQARGGPQDEELATYRMAIGLIRGPDNMWYLNQGTLPDQS